MAEFQPVLPEPHPTSATAQHLDVPAETEHSLSLSLYHDIHFSIPTGLREKMMHLAALHCPAPSQMSSRTEWLKRRNPSGQ
jgi:hypothetical protein